MNVSFSSHLLTAVTGTLNPGTQLDGLVTLEMYRPHKALAPRSSHGWSGLFCFGYSIKGFDGHGMATIIVWH